MVDAGRLRACSRPSASSRAARVQRRDRRVDAAAAAGAAPRSTRPRRTRPPARPARPPRAAASARAPARGAALYACSSAACAQLYWWSRARASARCAQGAATRLHALATAVAPGPGGAASPAAASSTRSRPACATAAGASSTHEVERAAAPVVTNHTPAFTGALDWVMLGRAVAATDDDDAWKVVRRLRLPDEAELAEAAFLPNAAWPSDHLLVAADVVLPRALELRPGGFERLAVCDGP